MNDAATATAIFPFIGMNRVDKPDEPRPSPQPPATSHHQHPGEKPATAHVTAGPAGQPAIDTNHETDNQRRPSTRQPREREPTSRSQARSGPAATPPLRQNPSSPEGEHATDDRRRGAKQPAPAGRGKPDRFTSDHKRGASTGRNSEKRNKLPSNGIDTSKLAGLSPPGEPSQRSRDSRTATEHSRSDRNIPARAGFGASADGSSRGSIPAHAGREHNEEVDRRSTANTVEHPSNRG